jgi:serine-type D-Ala-D-Ala carboxypeptidase (penicillin-binding protein 5/6)
MQRFFTNTFQSLLCIIFFANASQALADDLGRALQESQFYFLIDADTKEVLLSKNPDTRVAPSSMTKLMTAYVIFDQVKKGKLSLENECLIGKDAWRKSGSSMFLNYGDIVSIEDLVKGLLAVSGNDAAIALAQTTGGSIEGFASLMNAKAKEIGLKNSHFKNPHGLHENDHYMTVRDLATLAIKICQDFPQYSHYFGIPEFTYRRITQKNRNPLIKTNYDGAIGGKTGHTDEGGYGVVGIVKRDNRRLIGVINKAKTPKQRAAAIIEIFDYGFSHYKKLSLFTKDQKITKVKTWLGKKSQVDVFTKEEVSFNIPRDRPVSAVNVNVKYKSPVYAPIKQGDEIAKLVVEIKGYKTFEYPLFAQENVDKAGYFMRINQILRYKIANFYNKIFK